MSAIQDQGKVWLRGHVKPVLAVKVDGNIIIPEMEHGDSTEFWCKSDGLCVDIHHTKNAFRIARWFPNNIQGDAPGTLFSGFDETKHADILAALPDNPQVVEKKFIGETYGEVKRMEPKAFFEYASLVKL